MSHYNTASSLSWRIAKFAADRLAASFALSLYQSTSISALLGLSSITLTQADFKSLLERPIPPSSVVIFYIAKMNKSSAVAEMGDCLATTGMGRKMGGAAVGGWVPTGSPSNTMWPGPKPTSLPSGILIHPTVWPQL